VADLTGRTAPPWRARLIAGALALVLLGLGFAGGWFGSQLNTPGDTSADAGFARDMSRHHAQAVEMGMVAFRQASDPQLQTMSYNIATTQQYQIGMMQSWLTEWHLSPTPPNGQMAWIPGGPQSLLPDGRMPGMASRAEIDKLKGSTGKDFDILFCQLMLRHHLGGVHMAQEAKQLASDADVKILADQIIVGQQKEITIFNEKLTELGAKPL
jgi:uncharacterized protein (DUF305 family)